MLELLATLPPALVYLYIFTLGVIIGSFLNVVLYRLHTGKSLAGSSHCLSCGTSLTVYELVPLVSYVVLRGRCRTCSSYIPGRYFLVELLTGGLFLGVALTVSDLWTGLILLVLVSILVVVAVYDLYHFIIPDELVVALVGVALVLQGFYLYQGVLLMAVFYNLLAASAASAFLYGLWKYSKGRWIGFGDVKLAWPLGVVVGYAGVFSMLVLSFWVGAVVGLFLLAVSELRKRGQTHLRFLAPGLTMKSAVPFAPFMIIGCLLVLFFGIDVVTLFTYVW